MTPSDEVTLCRRGACTALCAITRLWVGRDSLVGSWIDEATVQYQGDFAKLDIAAPAEKSKNRPTPRNAKTRSGAFYMVFLIFPRQKPRSSTNISAMFRPGIILPKQPAQRNPGR